MLKKIYVGYLIAIFSSCFTRHLEMFHILAREEAVRCTFFSLAPSFLLFHQSVVFTFIKFSIIKSHCPLCQAHLNRFCCLPTLLPGLGLFPTLGAVVLSC